MLLYFIFYGLLILNITQMQCFLKMVDLIQTLIKWEESINEGLLTLALSVSLSGKDCLN